MKAYSKNMYNAKYAYLWKELIASSGPPGITFWCVSRVRWQGALAGC